MTGTHGLERNTVESQPTQRDTCEVPYTAILTLEVIVDSLAIPQYTIILMVRHSKGDPNQDTGECN